MRWKFFLQASVLSLYHDQGLGQMEVDELAIIQDEARGMKGPRAILESSTPFIDGESGESAYSRGELK